MTNTKTPLSTLLYRQQRHEQARKEVQEYLKKYPKGPPLKAAEPKKA